MSRRNRWVLGLLGVVLFFSGLPAAVAVAAETAVPAPPASGTAPAEVFHLSGTVTDTHGEPVQEARVKVLVNGEPRQLLVEGKETEETETSSHGTYQLAFTLPEGLAAAPGVQLELYKTSYGRNAVEVSPGDFALKGSNHFLVKDLSVKRVLSPAFWIATVVFLVIYALISFEVLHRTIAAVLGASLMLLISYTLGTLNPDYHILSFDKAMGVIDMNVIFLLMGMMIIVGILKHTGVFQWCAYQSFRMAKGNVLILSAISCVFIAVTSAFLDNVTTMLLYTPVLIEIALALKISPLTLLLPGVMASNVGGTATLIGDPPNIIIGSYTGFTFMQFVENLTVPCIVATAALLVYTKFYYGKAYAQGKVENVDKFIATLKEQYKITDHTLLGYGLFITGLAIAFFVTHGYWHMEVCIPALAGAAVLFTYAVKTKKVKMLELIEKDIEWPTLLFFMFLFVVVGAVEETGLLAIIADWVFDLSQGNLVIAISLILWISAIMSAFVDNIPFVATMLPIVAYLTKVIPGAADQNVLWWALSLGACLGGNGTMIGASANVVTTGIAESAGHPISFGGFMKYAWLYMLISVAISHAWLLLFY